MTTDPDLHNKILFCDETRFCLKAGVIVFGVMIIHKPLLKGSYVFKRWLFGVNYGQKILLLNMSFKIKPETINLWKETFG